MPSPGSTARPQETAPTLLCVCSTECNHQVPETSEISPNMLLNSNSSKTPRRTGFPSRIKRLQTQSTVFFFSFNTCENITSSVNVQTTRKKKKNRTKVYKFKNSLAPFQKKKKSHSAFGRVSSVRNQEENVSHQFESFCQDKMYSSSTLDTLIHKCIFK